MYYFCLNGYQSCPLEDSSNNLKDNSYKSNRKPSILLGQGRKLDNQGFREHWKNEDGYMR